MLIMLVVGYIFFSAMYDGSLDAMANWLLSILAALVDSGQGWNKYAHISRGALWGRQKGIEGRPGSGCLFSWSLPWDAQAGVGVKVAGSIESENSCGQAPRSPCRVGTWVSVLRCLLGSLLSYRMGA